MRIKTKYIAVTAAATVFLGVRGLLVGALILIYLLSNPDAARPAASSTRTSTRRSPAPPPSFTRRNPTQPPPSSSSSSLPTVFAPKAKDVFGGGGRGNKLGSS